MNYTVIIEKTPNGYSAYPPDFPGCIAAADSLDEVRNSSGKPSSYTSSPCVSTGMPSLNLKPPPPPSESKPNRRGRGRWRRSVGGRRGRLSAAS
jgi:hypothetical protein